MTPEEQRFESWKYARRISLVRVGGDTFGLAGPDLRLIKIGTLDELHDDIYRLGHELAMNPHAAKPPKPLEEVSLDYLTEIDL